MIPLNQFSIWFDINTTIINDFIFADICIRRDAYIKKHLPCIAFVVYEDGFVCLDFIQDAVAKSAYVFKRGFDHRL